MLSQVSLFSSSPHGRGLSQSTHGSVPALRTGVAFPRAHTALFSRSPHEVQPFPERVRVCSPTLRTGVSFPRARTALFSRSPHEVQPFPEHTRLCSHVLHTRHDLLQGTHAPVLPVLHTGGILSQGAHRIPFSRPAPVPRDTMCFPSIKIPPSNGGYFIFG